MLEVKLGKIILEQCSDVRQEILLIWDQIMLHTFLGIFTEKGFLFPLQKQKCYSSEGKGKRYMSLTVEWLSSSCKCHPMFLVF